MNVRRGRTPRLLMLAVGMAASTGAGTLPAAASGAPTAELSINPGHGALTVDLVARSRNFSTRVVTFQWTFGDGTTAMTSSHQVSHRYPSAATFLPSVVEIDSQGEQASANGTLELADCPVGTAQCNESLAGAGGVQLLQATGPVTSGAEVNLFVGPFKISHCEPEVAPAAALTDSMFSGALTVTLKYVTTHPAQVQTTCFASPVSFMEVGGQTVTSGPLQACSTPAPPPCVKSIDISGSNVTKVLVVPPGDPKVGAP
jgi:hypothetical protein